jgi:hypothetical protein
MYRVLMAAFAAAGACGCGNADYCHPAGVVSVSGRPLPKGSIGFEPENPANPSGLVAVQDGKFEVPTSKGLLPGRYKVTVNPPLVGIGDPPPEVMFTPFTTALDVPTGDSEHKIDVTSVLK